MRTRVKVCCIASPEEAALAIAADAIRSVRPYGLDICSGVRTDGRLDPDKLHAFMRVVAAAA